MGFSDALKVLAAKALGFDRSDEELIALMDSLKEDACLSVLYAEPDAPIDPFRDDSVMHSLTGREYLQFFGDNTRRVLGETVWIDKVLPRYREDDVTGENYVERALQNRYPGVDVLCLTDERYPNEANRVRNLGGVNWEIIKPGLESDGHISETPLPRSLVDRQIINDGDLTDLFNAVATACDEDLV